MDLEDMDRCGCWRDGTLCPPCAAALGAHVRRNLAAGTPDEDTLRLPLAQLADRPTTGRG